MSGNCFVDTNVLVYVRDTSDPEKQRTASAWLTAIWESQIGRLSFQVLNEYYVTVTRKLKPGLDHDSARLDIKNLMVWNPVVVDKQVVEDGWSLQDKYGYSWWDSLVIAAAQRANCSVILTEDFQHNQQVEELTIINPFKTKISDVI